MTPPTDADAADAALLARVAAGEREAPLAELYDRYGGRLYGLGLRLLGDTSQAEELVQETFVRLWQGAGRFDARKGTVGTWVRVIARRVAIDLQRRAASRPRAAGRDALAGDGPIEPMVTEETVERTLLALELREALEALSTKHREVLELGYEEDLTQREIAERLEIPLGTVKTRTFNALRALKVVLEERGLA